MSGFLVFVKLDGRKRHIAADPAYSQQSAIGVTTETRPQLEREQRRLERGELTKN
jgi:hypothetical protein